MFICALEHRNDNLVSSKPKTELVTENSNFNIVEFTAPVGYFQLPRKTKLKYDALQCTWS